MAKGKNKQFSDNTSQRDWDEMEENLFDDDFDDDYDDYEDAPAEEPSPKSKKEKNNSTAPNILHSMKSAFSSLMDKGKKSKSSSSKKKGDKGKKSPPQDEDYEFDDLPQEEPAPAGDEDSYYYEPVPSADDFEEAPPAYRQSYPSTPEEVYFEDEEPSYSTEELYPPEPFEEENQEDPFASLKERAANPPTDYEEDEADIPYDEEYDEEYDGEYYQDEWDDQEVWDDQPEEEMEEEMEEEQEEAPVPQKSSRSHAHSAKRRVDAPEKKAKSLVSVLMPAMGVLALVALGTAIVAIYTLLNTPNYKDAQEPLSVSEPTATPFITTSQPTEAELQAQGQATPLPSEETTTVRAKRDAEGRIVPDVGGAVVPARNVKLSMDDFSTSTMIGNSFVEGMKTWGSVDSISYVCADGVSLDNMIGNYLYYVTVRNYDAIYLCLGLNEIGWNVDSFITKYEKVIDYIRSDGTSKTKNATIYIVSVMPVEEIMETVPGESGSTISKSTIVSFNERLKTMCQEKGCWYLDVYSALANDKGYLPDEIAAADHVHFEKTGYRIWSEYLQNHYVDEKLLGDQQ